MKILDEWKSPHAILDEFIECMREKGNRSGNPPETIDYKNLKVGEKVTIEKSSKKC